LKPAKYDVSDIKRIAVVDFQGPKQSGNAIAALFTDKLWKTQYFQMVEREKIEQVLEEHAFNMSGAVDDATIVEFGKILGVDAIVVGNVSSYTTRDTRGKEKVKKEVFTGKYEKDAQGNFIYEKNKAGKKVKKKIYKEELVDQQYLMRESNVAVSYRMIEIQTAEIRASDQGQRSFKKKYTTNLEKLPSKGSLLNNLSDQIVAGFIPNLVPHRITLRKSLEKDNDAVNLGINFAKNGLWNEAIQSWESEVKNHPDNAKAFYNLGIAYEALGEIDKAEGAYRSAMRIKPKKLYMQAVSQIETRKKDQIELQKQLRGHDN